MSVATSFQLCRLCENHVATQLTDALRYFADGLPIRPTVLRTAKCSERDCDR